MTERKTRRRRWPVWSVRARLMAVIAATAAIGLAGVGAAVYVVERERILSTTDDLLRSNLGAAQAVVQGYVEETPGVTARDALRMVVQRISPDDNMGVLGIVDGSPELVPGIPLDLQLESEPDFVRYVVDEANGREAFIGRYAEGDVAWQYIVTPIVLAGSPDGATSEADAAADESVLFVMAYDLRAELAEINGPGRAYLIASAVMILLIVLIGAFAAGRLLRPIRHMRETAERVSGQNLEERLPIEGHDDVSELARTMNDMLDRLDQALDSQRQLLSDVRHELRTPITIVRGHLELMNADDPADVRDTQELAVDELDRMNVLVQDLSEAAALHGPAPVVIRPTDVGELLSQIIRKAAALEGAEVTAGPAVAAVVPLDPARVTQAVLQLAQNGATHGGGRLVIGSRIAGPMLEIWVRDFGPGVADENKQSVFERFQRGGSDARGSGLGLNIVQVIARAHGGYAQVIDALDKPGAVFILSIPLDAASPHATAPTIPIPASALPAAARPSAASTGARTRADDQPTEPLGELPAIPPRPPLPPTAPTPPEPKESPWRPS